MTADDIAHIASIGQRVFARINSRAIVSLNDGTIARGIVCPNNTSFDPKGNRYCATLLLRGEEGDREFDFLDIKNVV